MGLGSLIKDKLSKPGGSLSGSGSPTPAAPASTPGQKPSSRQIFQNRFNHGPNLGGMFVLERWISGDDLFEGTDKTSELEAVKATVKKHGLDGARAKFENHWTSWLDEGNDWNWLQSKGVTAVRVPIGYWTVDNGKFTRHTPFEEYQAVYQNAWNIFKSHVIKPAAARNIAVLIDLHALPGGANEQDHSGTSSGKAEFWSHSSSVDLATDILKFIASDMKSYDNICGIQIINEAPYANNPKHQQNYYFKALSAIRGANPDIPVVISDGWNTQQFISIIKDHEDKLSGDASSLGLIIDTHVYKCFSDEDKRKPPGQLIQDVDSAIPQTGDVDILVGEYSCVMDEGTWKQLPQGQNRDQIVSDYGRRQVSHFYQRAKAGQYFWTYKFHWGSGGEWGFREMSDKGALPDYSQIPSKSPDVYQNAFNDRLKSSLDEHVNYWKGQDANKDWQNWRYEDGFTIGWHDAQAFDEFNHSEIGRWVAWKKSRLSQHVQQKGSSDLLWVFSHGFDKGVEQFIATRNS
ncbi:17-beta-hydroxysteroid dehydrogenase-like protein [Sugiyamaella lignohabitans]|uniref:17-beta-hydroxysteroid dehydrogenase-like protein n=1 Tax=Sugiyamaella lignohabitans TaxID=796027 RepID=A0A161HHU6_9ASCO|nr:17-beta-hydroxysteroid dehydrogenase-like protein [Sugiyamaella lignohabitans]ANB11837.1 17-beta-hydroxysteroid dehydrogenase-like protein [Sugiyamaella lignohabitans]